jgi:hypothetical protein
LDLDWFILLYIEKDKDIMGKGTTIKFTSPIVRFTEKQDTKVLIGIPVGAWSMKLLLWITGYRLRGGL